MIDDIEVTEYSYVHGLFGVAKHMAKKEEDIQRDGSGKFVKGVSGNPLGRKKGTKNSASKARLENLTDKFGSLAFKEIYQMGKEAQERGDITNAYKCFSFVAGQYVTITLHNDRMQVQQSNKRPEELSDEQDDDLQNGAIIQVNFSKVGSV